MHAHLAFLPKIEARARLMFLAPEKRLKQKKRAHCVAAIDVQGVCPVILISAPLDFRNAALDAKDFLQLLQDTEIALRHLYAHSIDRPAFPLECLLHDGDASLAIDETRRPS